MDKGKPVGTPMSTKLKITKDNFKDKNNKSIDQHDHRSMIRLLDLIASRSNIAYPVGVCARYQTDTKESHKQL